MGVKGHKFLVPDECSGISRAACDYEEQWYTTYLELVVKMLSNVLVRQQEGSTMWSDEHSDMIVKILHSRDREFCFYLPVEL